MDTTGWSPVLHYYPRSDKDELTSQYVHDDPGTVHCREQGDRGGVVQVEDRRTNHTHPYTVTNSNHTVDRLLRG